MEKKAQLHINHNYLISIKTYKINNNIYEYLRTNGQLS